MDISLIEDLIKWGNFFEASEWMQNNLSVEGKVACMCLTAGMVISANKIEHPEDKRFDDFIDEAYKERARVSIAQGTPFVADIAVLYGRFFLPYDECQRKILGYALEQYKLENMKV